MTRVVLGIKRDDCIYILGGEETHFCNKIEIVGVYYTIKLHKTFKSFLRNLKKRIMCFVDTVSQSDYTWREEYYITDFPFLLFI